MPVDRKRVAEKLLELLQDDGKRRPSNWVGLQRREVRLDGMWNIDRIADGIAREIEGDGRGEAQRR